MTNTDIASIVANDATLKLNVRERRDYYRGALKMADWKDKALKGELDSLNDSLSIQNYSDEVKAAVKVLTASLTKKLGLK